MKLHKVTLTDAEASLLGWNNKEGKAQYLDYPERLHFAERRSER